MKTTKKRKKEEDDEPVVCVGIEASTSTTRIAETLLDHNYPLQKTFDIVQLNKKERDDFVVSIMLSKKYTEVQKREYFEAAQIYTEESQKERREIQKVFYSVFDMEIPMEEKFKGHTGFQLYLKVLSPKAAERLKTWHDKEKYGTNVCAVKCMVCQITFARLSIKKGGICYNCLNNHVFHEILASEIEDFQQVINDILKTMTNTIMENKEANYEEQVTEFKNQCIDTLMEEKYQLSDIVNLLNLTNEERTSLNIRLLSLDKYTDVEKKGFVRSLLRNTEDDKSKRFTRQAIINSVFCLEIIWSFEYGAKTTSYYLNKLSKAAFARLNSWLKESKEAKLIPLKCYICDISYVYVDKGLIKDSAFFKSKIYDDASSFWCCNSCLSDSVVDEQVILKVFEYRDILQKMVKVIQDKVVTSEPLIKK